MNIFFIIMCGIYVLNLGIAMAKHGEPKEDNYNFIASLIGALIGITLIYFAVKTGF